MTDLTQNVKPRQQLSSFSVHDVHGVEVELLGECIEFSLLDKHGKYTGRDGRAVRRRRKAAESPHAARRPATSPIGRRVCAAVLAGFVVLIVWLANVHVPG